MKQVQKYPMCKDQPCQIDYRVTTCQYYSDSKCINIAPAITLNEDKTFVCWSEESKRNNAN